MIVIVQIYTLLSLLQQPVSERYMVLDIGRYIKYRKKELLCFEMWLYLDFFVLGGFGMRRYIMYQPERRRDT